MSEETKEPVISDAAREAAKEIYALPSSCSYAAKDIIQRAIDAATQAKDREIAALKEQLEPIQSPGSWAAVLQERDQLRSEVERLKSENQSAVLQWNEQVSSLRAQLAEALEREGRCQDLLQEHTELGLDWKHRAEAAEAQVRTLREALEEIARHTWKAAIEEAMRGGFTPACAAESMQLVAKQALAATAPKEESK